MRVLFAGLGAGVAAAVGVGVVVLSDEDRCEDIAEKLNDSFKTVSVYNEINQIIPNDSGVIVHTIHGPSAPGFASDSDMKYLNGLAVDENKTCAELIGDDKYLPWCGSNTYPGTDDYNDTSSWSYLRQDTLVNVQDRDEVMCNAGNNRRYGLVFSNEYMNEADNLGCLYPVDADTVERVDKACGIDRKVEGGKGFCAADITKDEYLSTYDKLVSSYGADARKYTCSLRKSQFDVWVDVRKDLKLAGSDAPVDEFILNNWGQKSTKDIAEKDYLVGIYYLTGCVGTPPPPRGSTPPDADKDDAQKIADLFKKWSGKDIPVLELSNERMRKGALPFSCPI